MRAWIPAVLSLGVSCASNAGGSTVLLRNSIGPDNTTTNTNFPFNSTRAQGFFVIPVRLEITAPVVLTEFRGVAGQMTSSVDWNRFDFNIRVWSSQAALEADPSFGDVANATLATPTSGPDLFGVIGDFGWGPRPSYLVTFDLSPMGITVSPGETRFLGIEFQSVGGTGLSGALGWVESTEAGASEVMYRSSGPPLVLATSPSSRHDGRIAVEVTAELVSPPCPGDANADGVVNFTDLNIVLSDYGLTGAPGSLQGDLDDDGDVDFADLNIVLSEFGTTC